MAIICFSIEVMLSNSSMYRSVLTLMILLYRKIMIATRVGIKTFVSLQKCNPDHHHTMDMSHFHVFIKMPPSRRTFLFFTLSFSTI
ncbi:hypothetical protein E4665_02605 [Sporolactobacillus shoreae]|uniref:Uncharacterized protein n=1 Tax=Sporolactobacillus shoreae TaxID=1465501 RepID=A0A4Z0GSH4_9BACL|nr:hypothetical protein E4665_02605 [Sporolactobacillus shoreae]